VVTNETNRGQDHQAAVIFINRFPYLIPYVFNEVIRCTEYNRGLTKRYSLKMVARDKRFYFECWVCFSTMKYRVAH
jgi:hypothetical protein